MINSSKPYRYLRYYTPNGFANVGELEFYEKIVDRTLLTLLLEQANAVVAGRFHRRQLCGAPNGGNECKIGCCRAPSATQSDVDAAADNLEDGFERLDL